MSHVAVGDQTFEEEVVKSERAVLVDFWAEWCGPCKMLEPIIDELANEMGGKVKFAKVDVDTNQEVASKYNILSIPTVILFKKGEPVSQLIGVQPKERYLEEINKVAGS